MTSWRSRLVSAATISTLILAVAAPAAASSDLTQLEREAARWASERWADSKGLRAEKLDGSGITIAVIDDAVNPDAAELRGADLEVKGSTCSSPDTEEPREIVSTDPSVSHHGTNVVAALVGNGAAADGGVGTQGIVPAAKIWFYGVGPVEDIADCTLRDPTVDKGGVDLSSDLFIAEGDVISENPGRVGDATALAARAAIRDGADIVSVSIASGVIGWDQVLAEAEIAGVAVVVAAPNPDDSFAPSSGPSVTNGALPVSAIDVHGEQLSSSGTGAVGAGSSMMGVAAPGVDILGVGSSDAWGPTLVSGTSIATPLVAGVLALGLEKFPEASAFQIMQALVRTSGSGSVHEPQWNDEFIGYGYANPQGVLESDPSKFVDENPMFVRNIEDSRCSQSSGSQGKIDSSGRWVCEWSSGPFPPLVDKYARVLQGQEPILSIAGEEVSSPYAVSGQAASDAPRTLSYVLIGVGFLVVVGGIVITLVLARSRKASRAEQFSEMRREQS